MEKYLERRAVTLHPTQTVSYICVRAETSNFFLLGTRQTDFIHDIRFLSTNDNM